MAAETTLHLPPHLHPLAVTALLLQRLEAKPAGASPAQYQGLVRQLDRLLAAAEDDPMLSPLLDNLPALSELHENRHFAHAGLCRAPLEDAVAAEREAQTLLARMRGAPPLSLR